MQTSISLMSSSRVYPVNNGAAILHKHAYSCQCPLQAHFSVSRILQH